MNKVGICVVVVFSSVLPIFAQGKAEPIKLTPCEINGTEPDKKEHVLCGKYEVFEDRVRKAGRKIALKIVVYPATGPDKSPDPIFYIPGGPGSPAIEEAPYVAEDLAKLRTSRDLVFVDQRGTGGSNPLNCELFDPKDIRSYMGHWNPPAAVKACRAQLEKTADLKLYVTSIAMDDLDDVRRALGYGKINLSGSSYGTRAVMTYVKQHGPNVRAVLLHGVSPVDQFMPREFPQHTQRALDGVLDECRANADCAKTFPDIKKAERSVLAMLKKGPDEVDVI